MARVSTGAQGTNDAGVPDALLAAPGYVARRLHQAYEAARVRLVDPVLILLGLGLRQQLEAIRTEPLDRCAGGGRTARSSPNCRSANA